MKLYHYWASAELTATDSKGKNLRLKKWAGSNDSLSAAKADAERAVRAVRDQIGKFAPPRDGYSYSTRDVPEEIVRDLGPENVFTRNAIGFLVLNTTQIFFADIDLPRGPGFIARLFGASPQKPEIDAIARLKRFLDTRPSLGARIYRTRAGLRYLFTHAPQAVNDETLGWLKELDSDALYTKLCKNQQCFRARLSPKPWRIDVERPNRYPRETPEAQSAFRDWLRDYESKSGQYAVCKYLEAAGAASIHRDLEKLIREHDTATRSDSDLPLA